tara:strand:+ start:1202 stop:1564 length:363 start_codon:yes stop_codon:yes gene_type:complete
MFKKPKAKALWMQVREMLDGILPIKMTPKTKRQSSKRAKQTREYRARVKEWIVAKKCQRCGGKAVECHHSHGRSGKLLLHEPFWIPLCSKCHFWVTNHTADARVIGLVCDMGKWNDQSLV